MPDEAVELDERARVEQELDALAREELAPLVLPRDRLLGAGVPAASLSSRSQASFASVVSWRVDIGAEPNPRSLRPGYSDAGRFSSR